MKELIFVRHAKSDWGNEYLKDIDRPLNDRGYSNAYEQFEWYTKTHSVPDFIICSTATRTISTAMIYVRASKFNLKNVELNSKIYESNVTTVFSVIEAISENYNKVMIVGHNPFTTNCCNELNNDLFFENVPTCGIVSISFNTTDWKQVTQLKGKINFHRFPKDYKND